MKRSGKKLLSLLLALVFTLALIPAALADESTTTRRSASKDTNARTEMYVVSNTPGSDYPVFGAKNEPAGGVYYGRYANEVNRLDQSMLAGESVIGCYIDINNAVYGLDHWSYLFKDAIQDGTRALEISMNFPNEGGDCAPAANGTYDSYLIRDFQSLNTLTCPVFLRIGGEMNCWGVTPATPAEFIPAFQHVATMCRTYAPNVAIIFSTNFSSANNVDMDTFYPGDAYVDWVGTSLYYNYTGFDDYKDDKFLGVGEVYGDPMLNVQQTINLAKLHNKPVFITEGGSFSNWNGNDYSAFAAERTDKALSFLPMVYPEIKAIVTSNYDNWNFESNSTVGAGYQHGVSNNPVLRKTIQDTPSYYTKASVYAGAWEGTMRLAAYTYSSTKLSATWSVDGQTMATVTEYPYTFNLNTSALPAGQHTVTVTFSNGQSKQQTFTSRPYNAEPTPDKLYVGDQLQTPAIYKIGDNNYFMLRDVAMLLNGTEKQFFVDYDNTLKAVMLTTGQPYVPNGTESTSQAVSGKYAEISPNTIYINGVKVDNMTVYQIDGSNYFKLRDLGKALDFYVGWDNSTKSVTISGSQGYQD